MKTSASIPRAILPPLRALSLAALLLSLAACDTGSSSSGGGSGDNGGSSADEDTEEEPMLTADGVVSNMVNNTIVVDITAFRVAAETMRANVDTFCAAPDEAGLETLQADWRAMSEAWSAAVPYNFGPLDDDVITPKIIFIESMRQRGTDYTDTVREGLLAGLEGTDPLDATFFDSQTFTRVGMLALEVLVFEDSREGNSQAPADIVADYQERPRKCEYLRGVAQLLTDDAIEVDQGWNQGFGDAGEPFKDTMLGDELADGSEPIAALLIALQDHLNYVKVRKLEAVQDAQLSGHFFPNILATMTAIENLLVQPTPEESYGLLDFMEAIGFVDEVALTKTNLAAAKQAAANQDLDGLIVAIGLVEGNIKREIPDSLGIDLGITFSDGD